ncbi:AAA family ATPase, partial [Undibacterium sp. LFS511W]|nr:AAA family ATPase [Undibacterium luofuense]
MTQLEHFLNRAEQVLARLEALLPAATPVPDWALGSAFRWRKRGGVGYLQVVRHPATIRLDDLCNIAAQKKQ